MQPKEHWEKVYSTKATDAVSWFQPHAEFGEAFSLLSHKKEAHNTPSGTVQQFVYCYCRRIGS